jgi:hypothetical protein
MKRSITIKLLSFAILSFLMLSCSVQKRQYMSGYYVSWKKNKAGQNVNPEKELKPLTNVAEIAPEDQTMQKEKTSDAVASANKNDIAITTERSKLPLIHRDAAGSDIKKSDSRKFSFIPNLKPKALREGGTYNGFAIASMVLGILALVTYYGAFVFGVLAIIFGAIALKRIRNNPDQKGRGMAIAGLICGIVALTAMLIVFTLISALAFA